MFDDDEAADAADGGRATLSWEFASEARSDGSRVDRGPFLRRPPLGSGARPEQGRGRQRLTDGVILDQLDHALDRWWQAGELPSLRLLHDGLRLLEAGGNATEAQRTLLMRTALAYGKGVMTALRHQHDLERVALLVAEMTVTWEPPLTLDVLSDVARAGGAALAVPLLRELERLTVVTVGEDRRRAWQAARAVDALAMLETTVEPPLEAAAARPGGGALRRWGVGLLLVVAGFFLWQRLWPTPPADMVLIPAGTYVLLGLDEVPVPVETVGYLVDRMEVSNGEYRRCVEAGACPWPTTTASATRRDYFVTAAYDNFPVVNVTYAAAEAYCRWQAKRLPTAGEWQLAAGTAVLRGESFRYPWGEQFDAQRANGAVSQVGDTRERGATRPAGDSPLGGVDMAGNVAEWTATPATNPEGGDRLMVVKGGSFRSGAEGLQVAAEEYMAQGESAPWLGLRCARTYPTGGR